MAETMIGLPKKKQFTCGICHQSRTYGSWEDAEVYFQDDFIVHVGCLKNHYQELIQKGTLAFENLKSVLKGNYAMEGDTQKIIMDALNNLKGALRAE